MAHKSKRSGKDAEKPPLMIRCPEDIGNAIRDFCEGKDLKPAVMARFGLRFFIQELTSGRAGIVNGELKRLKNGNPTKE